MTSVADLLPHRVLAGLLLTIGAIAAPHALHLPVWLTAVVVICGIWRYMAGRNAWRLPPRILLILATLLLAGGVLASYGTIAGRDAGVALLTLLIGLKLLEMRSRRDTIVVLFLGYFLVVTQFLFTESLLTAGWMLVMVWAMTALLITVTRPTSRTLSRGHLRLAATMMCQALPVMLLLFLLFPRIPGPLWGMPEDDARGVTGLSDEMTPGMISQLSQSDAVAFRVEFDGEPPAPSQRYWRGPVLPDYDGRTWRRPDSMSSVPPPMEALAGEINYTVTLEPHNRDWIFTLDLPVAVSEAVRLGSEYELSRTRPVRERLRYQASSALHYRLDPAMSVYDPEPYRYLPDDAHPRTRDLAQRWIEETEDKDAFIDRSLRQFREEPFVYTLAPPLMQDDPVDQFLFDERRGFCENYASAFAVLMRAAGIPARVVTGYLGGEINPTGNYMIVRQSDAHAWVEIWREDQGWLRVDPTAWVAPDRIELGLADALADPEGLPAMARRDAHWTRELALRWDAVNAYWDRWVLAYGPSLQQRLMERFGLGNFNQLLAALAGGLLASVALLAIIILWGRPARPEDPAARLWRRLVHRLDRAGIPPRPSEGPRDYARRVMRERPDIAARMQSALDSYLRLRYARRARRDDLATLRASIASMKRA